MEKKTEKITIPPHWSWAILLGILALLIYLVEAHFGPFNLPSYIPNMWFFSILLFLGMLFYLCHYSFSESALEIKFLGIRLRSIYWFEVSSAVLVYSKDRTGGGLIYISIYPCQSVLHPPGNIILRMICHPTTIIAIHMASKYEKSYLEVFQQYCKNFTIQEKSNPQS